VVGLSRSDDALTFGVSLPRRGCGSITGTVGLYIALSGRRWPLQLAITYEISLANARAI